MSDLIQWPTAKYWTAQWNPIIGCKPCSPACENCYAAAWAKRFGQSFEPHLSSQTRPPRKGIVFCGNMTDLWGDFVEAICPSKKTYGHDSFQTEMLLHCHSFKATYLWLTKRAEKMCESVSFTMEKYERFASYFQRFHYFGFTAENQDCFLTRYIRVLGGLTRWANLWVSAEPLLGPIRMGLGYTSYHPKWVVVGCESGPSRRPCKIEWVESIVEQCRTHGVPVFVKQLEIDGRCVTDINQFPRHLRIRQVPWAKEGGAK